MNNILTEFLTAGVRFYPYESLNLQPGDTVTLLHEPDNQYAKHPEGAIALCKNGVKFGHVPEVELVKVHPVRNNCCATVSYVDIQRKYPAVMICVTV